jgi:hypothetical protein
MLPSHDLSVDDIYSEIFAALSEPVRIRMVRMIAEADELACTRLAETGRAAAHLPGFLDALDNPAAAAAATVATKTRVRAVGAPTAARRKTSAAAVRTAGHA